MLNIIKQKKNDPVIPQSLTLCSIGISNKILVNFVSSRSYLFAMLSASRVYAYIIVLCE